VSETSRGILCGAKLAAAVALAAGCLKVAPTDGALA
jgi:hypothetical protein